jgi:predicted alpha-1,2-mannosidase
MKTCNFFKFSALAFFFFVSQAIQAQKNFIQYVNPFIGTGGHGHTFPGAVYPFGMMQLSPDTRLEGWDGCSGYHYTDSIIYGFSHTHLSGTGVPDYCDVLFMPGNGEVFFNNGYNGKPGYSSLFKKSSEQASAGHYSVFLEKYSVQVELTVGKRTGVHKYTYPQSKDQWVLIDLKHRDPLIKAAFNAISSNEVNGFRISKAWAQQQHIYFASRFNKKIVKHQYSDDSLVLVLHFEDNGIKELIAHVGISAVDIPGAQKNLQSEFNEFNFQKIKKQTQSEWNKMLSRIRVEGKNKTDKIIFYTALYHNLIHPSLYQDIDGRYRGMDLKIHKDLQDDHFTVFSLWDTYRSTHPLYQLVYPDYNSKFIRTFLRQYQQCGHLPVWELAANETWCMIGNHAIPVIANAFHHKVFDFDTSLAKEAITNSIVNGNNTGMPFMKKGFIAANDEAESVSKSIENCVDFAAARSIGCLENTPYHPEAYKNLFNPETGFFQARLNNSFIQPFDPKEVNHHFTEANAYQYLFGAHHDISGLIELFALKANPHTRNRYEIFREKLDSLFMTNSDMSGRVQPDVTGLIGQYAHGNEPSHHKAYLYNHSGSFHQTQDLIQKIKKEFYKNAPDGLIGNEDCGQMSSWYVFSALGFYPVNPFDAHYYLGFPSFEKAFIDVPGHKKIRILAKSYGNASKVFSFRMNGINCSPRFKLEYGDQITYELGNHTMGISYFQQITEDNYQILPYISKGQRVFEDSTVVKLSSLQSSEIEFSFDTSAGKIHVFRDSLIFRNETDLFFRNAGNNAKNQWLHSKFSKKPKGIKLHLQSKYADHYAAGGKDALIDGLTGSDDYRDGFWQGFQGTDLNLTIEFDTVRQIHRLGLRCMQDQPSWILMPESIEFESSLDGMHFKNVQTLINDVPKTEEQKTIIEYTVHLAPEVCRYIRIRAKNPGILPEWHRGAGGQSWIFADEIRIR